ncbi:MAG: carbon-nitrogen hydrolase family protein [Myxococcota bacterium]
MALIAAVQLSCSSDLDRNWETAEGLIRRAAGYGASLIATPEATDYLGPHSQKMAIAEPLDGPRGQRYANLARELGVTLLIGSVAEPHDDQRTYNTSVLFGPDGARLARYRKMHLFDVDLAAVGGVTFKESQRTAAGEDVIVAETPMGRLGMSICFDLRFGALYRAMVDQGATILAVPSAFTMMTGKDHWHALLRARAIENQCWVIAPGQCGEHDDKGLRHSYGHSLIVDPWGRVVAECGDAPGVAIAEMDPTLLPRIRERMPMAANRRL